MEKENEGVEEIVQDAPIEQENALENEGSDGATDSDEGTEIDYKAELEKVSKDRDNYKEGLLVAKDKLKKKGSSVDPEEIAKIVKETMKEEIGSLHSLITGNTLESALSKLTDNPAKKDLIKFHYENSIIKTGSIDEDLENALLIADKKTILKQTKELAIAAQNRSQIGNSSMGSNSKSGVIKKFFKDEQIADLKKRGFTDKMIENLQNNMAKTKN